MEDLQPARNIPPPPNIPLLAPQRPKRRFRSVAAPVVGLTVIPLLILALFFMTKLKTSTASAGAAWSPNAMIGAKGAGKISAAARAAMAEDADHDGLPAVTEKVYRTRPLNADTDRDGLADGDEAFVFGTSPTKANSWTSPYDDGANLKNGFDPRHAGVKFTDAQIASFKTLIAGYPLHEPTLTTLKGSAILP